MDSLQGCSAAYVLKPCRPLLPARLPTPTQSHPPQPAQAAPRCWPPGARARGGAPPAAPCSTTSPAPSMPASWTRAWQPRTPTPRRSWPHAWRRCGGGLGRAAGWAGRRGRGGQQSGGDSCGDALVRAELRRLPHLPPGCSPPQAEREWQWKTEAREQEAASLGARARQLEADLAAVSPPSCLAAAAGCMFKHVQQACLGLLTGVLGLQGRVLACCWSASLPLASAELPPQCPHAHRLRRSGSARRRTRTPKARRRAACRRSAPSCSGS